jgi:hypothetical protein
MPGPLAWMPRPAWSQLRGPATEWSQWR